MTIPKIIEKAGYIGIRDQVSLILATEIPAQLALAISEADTDYQAMLESFYLENGDLSIYTERFIPFDVQEYNAINVWITNVDESEGSNSRKQIGKVNINIDIATINDEEDSNSARYMQWMGSTIRGILNSGQYQVLGYTKPSIIKRRWVTGVNVYQPNETDNINYLYGGSVNLIVEYEEFNTTVDGAVCTGNDSIIATNEYEILTNGQFKITT